MAESNIRKLDLAKELKVSSARVSQWVAAGLPVEKDGRLNRQRALTWVSENVDRSGGGWPTKKAESLAETPAKPTTTDEPDQPPMQESPSQALIVSRARKLLAEAKLAEHKEKQQSGELLPTEEVKAAAFDVYRKVRDGCLNIPSRCAGAVMGEVRRALEAAGAPAEMTVKLSAPEINNLLAVELRKILDDLATAVEREGNK